MKRLTESESTAWLQSLLISSVPLRKIGSNGMPCSIASGCLVDVGKRRFLLSVVHAVQSGQDWAIEIDYDSVHDTSVYKPNHYHHILEGRLGVPDIRDVDFTFAAVPNDLVSYYLEITPYGGMTRREPRTVFRPDFSVRPSVEEIYGFAGQVMPEQHGETGFGTEMRVYPGLRFVSSDGPYLEFELPVPHPGHEHFEGCSGAPILDSAGNLLALVCRGETEGNRIIGVNVSRYQAALNLDPAWLEE